MLAARHIHTCCHSAAARSTHLHGQLLQLPDPTRLQQLRDRLVGRVLLVLQEAGQAVQAACSNLAACSTLVCVCARIHTRAS